MIDSPAAVVLPLPDDVGALKALLTTALARAANAVAREGAIEAVIGILSCRSPSSEAS